MSADWWTNPDWLGLVWVRLVALAALGLPVPLLLALRARRKVDPPASEDKEPAPLGDTVPPVAAQRRRTFRRGGARSALDVLCPVSGLRSGWVADRSVLGLALVLNAPVPPGALVRVRPRGVAAVVPWVEVEVRHCQRSDDGWRVGCRFLRPPPYPVLMLFG